VGSPLPTGTHPRKRFTFPSCPSLFLIKCILIVQGASPWYFRSVHIVLLSN
jgi:hypothetical protein